MQPDFAARALVNRIDDARVEWSGVDMQADGALSELARVAYIVHRVGGVHGNGVGGVDFHHVGWDDVAAV